MIRKWLHNRKYKTEPECQCGCRMIPTDRSGFDNYWKWHVNYGYTGEEGILATEADFASNPNLREGDPDNDNPCENDTDGDGYCYNYIGAYTHNSGFGAKCKVEMISRTDLLRAKGFKE